MNYLDTMGTWVTNEENTGNSKIEIASTIYREIYNNIRQTDEISFKILGFVPLVSGTGFF